MNSHEWETINRERGLLIERDINGTATDGELARLCYLNAYVDMQLSCIDSPTPPDEALCDWLRSKKHETYKLSVEMWREAHGHERDGND